MSKQETTEEGGMVFTSGSWNKSRGNLVCPETEDHNGVHQPVTFV